MSTGETITDAFLDWVKQTIAGTGLVADGCLFDEREKDLAWIIGNEVQGIGGLVCLVALPSISHEENTPMAGGYKVSCLVTLRRSVVLSNVASHAVAERLFRVFNTSKFYPGADAAELEGLNANVTADSLRHTTRGDADALHTMTLTVNMKIRY